MSDPLHPANVPIPIGCQYPSMAVASEEEAEPWEVADMRGFYTAACEPRYQWGHNRYGEASAHWTPLRNVDAAIEEVADELFYLRQARRLLMPQDGRLRCYLAGPYRAATLAERDANIDRARLAAGELLRRGHSPLCPHTHTAQFEEYFPDLPATCYLTMDLDWLLVAHALLLLEGWEDSRGARVEKAQAHALGIPVYYSLAEVPSPEEVRREWPPATIPTAATRA